MKLTDILNKPYPRSVSSWGIAIFVSAFIAVFLTVFQPFGLHSVNIAHKTLLIGGYGLVTFVMLLFNLFLLPQVFQRFFAEEKWAIWKQIVYLLIIVISISLANYVYSLTVLQFPWFGTAGLIRSVFFTFAIAIFPIVIITFVSQNLHLKNNLRLSARMNEKIAESALRGDPAEIIVLRSGTQKFKFHLNNIVFLESAGNYVEVNYIENEKLRKELVRNTLKRICAENPQETLFRCHRAFAVNIRRIGKVSGNSHGISLIMEKSEKQVPVSRSYTKAFTNLMSEIE
jgi:uncharacterized membrane protein YhdT